MGARGMEHPNSISLISTTCSPGDAAIDCQKLETLVARPNGRYAYAYALILTAAATCTPGQGAGDLAAVKAWQMLKSIFLRVKGIAKPIFNDVKLLDLLAMNEGLLQSLKPDMRSTFFPVAVTAASGGAQTVTVKYPIVFGTGYNKNAADKRTGLLPVSAIRGGELRVTPIASSAIQSDWTAGTIALTAKLKTVELDEPIECVPVFVETKVTSESRVSVPRGNGDTYYHGILVRDDADSDLTLPSSYSFEVDEKILDATRVGSDRVLEENMERDADINALFPDCLPVYSIQGKDVRNALLARSACVLENAGSGHSGAVTIVAKYSEDLSTEAQIQIQKEHGVDKAIAEAAVRQIDAMKNVKTRGRVTQTITQAAA